MEGWRATAGRDFGGEAKLALGFTYMNVERWQDALAVFESFTNKVVKPTSDGAWGAAQTIELTEHESEALAGIRGVNPRAPVSVASDCQLMRPRPL